MGEWTIDPTGKTATLTVEGNNAKVSVSENNGSSITYTVKFRQGDYCGEYKFTQEGTTPPEPQPSGLGNVYMNFELRNHTNQTIYSIPRIKLWIYKKENGIEYFGLFYIQEKNWVDRGCSNFEIPPYDQNNPVILSWNDLAFVDDSRIQDKTTDPDHWITKDFPASFMNNGMLLQSENNQEPYLYTYINGSNVPNNQRIKVFLVNPETGEKLPLGGSLNFSAGTESKQANYILDISLKEGASGTINSCT